MYLSDSSSWGTLPYVRGWSVIVEARPETAPVTYSQLRELLLCSYYQSYQRGGVGLHCSCIRSQVLDASSKA